MVPRWVHSSRSGEVHRWAAPRWPAPSPTAPPISCCHSSPSFHTWASQCTGEAALGRYSLSITLCLCQVSQPSVLRASTPEAWAWPATLPVYSAHGKPSSSMKVLPE